ncbi:MAG: integrase core domain-containing protein [Candidatus Thermoplasmatota archaeon]
MPREPRSVIDKIEHWHRTVKDELLAQCKSTEELRAHLPEYLEWYNCSRPHWGIDLRTPLSVYHADFITPEDFAIGASVHEVPTARRRTATGSTQAPATAPSVFASPGRCRRREVPRLRPRPAGPVAVMLPLATLPLYCLRVRGRARGERGWLRHVKSPSLCEVVFPMLLGM